MTALRLRHLALAAALAFVALPARAEQIAVGNFGVAANGMPFGVALTKGYFKEEGLEVEVNSTAGAAAAMQLVVGGRADDVVLVLALGQHEAVLEGAGDLEREAEVGAGSPEPVASGLAVVELAGPIGDPGLGPARRRGVGAGPDGRVGGHVLRGCHQGRG